jgi:hypothetical protein
LAEKYGTKIGGIIAGFPSTVLISLFFIGWDQTPIVASQATNIIPIVNGFNALFITAYVILLRYKNFYFSISLSLIIWFILSLSLVTMGFDNLLYSIAGFIFLWVFSYLILEKKLNIKSIKNTNFHFTYNQILFRAVFSGLVIAFTVLIARFGGPLFGGVFSTFPAVTLTTMIITYFSKGKEFSSAVLKVIMLTTINIVVYAFAVSYLYLAIGLIWGTLLSFIFSLLSSYLIFILVKYKIE